MFNPERGFPSEQTVEEPETTIEKKEDEPRPHFDAVIVFGGPLNIPENEGKITKFSNEKTKDFLSSLPENSTDNKDWLKWRKQTKDILTVETKTRALAGLEILKNSDVDKIIFTGGKFKNGKGLSEAELMRDLVAQVYQQELKRKVVKKEMTKEDAEKDLGKLLARIDTEEKAGNTVENFANTLNKIIDADKDKYQTLALVSSAYHLPRIAKMAEKFRVEGATMSSEEHMPNRSKHYNRFLANLFYADADPENEKNIIERPNDVIINPDYLKTIENEARWLRSMDVPMYWLPQALTVDAGRLEKIMKENPELKNVSPEEITFMLSLSTEQRNKLRELPPKELEDLEAVLPPEEYKQYKR